MSRSERVCKTLPPWMLRLILRLPSWRDWWASAYLELFDRQVAEVIAETAIEESGPWPCVMPRGIH